MTWTWVFFSFGLILTVALVYARVKSHGLLAKYAGILLVLCSSISIMGAGFWYSSAA